MSTARHLRVAEGDRTHPAGVAERSTAGSSLDVTGTLVVVGTRVWELVNTARTAATMTITDRGEFVHRAHGLTRCPHWHGSSQALHGHGTRGDTIYEDPASDWLGELDGQVVPVSRSAQRTPGGMTRVSATNTTTMAFS